MRLREQAQPSLDAIPTISRNSAHGSSTVSTRGTFRVKTTYQTPQPARQADDLRHRLLRRPVHVADRIRVKDRAVAGPKLRDVSEHEVQAGKPCSFASSGARSIAVHPVARAPAARKSCRGARASSSQWLPVGGGGRCRRR